MSCDVTWICVEMCVVLGFLFGDGLLQPSLPKNRPQYPVLNRWWSDPHPAPIGANESRSWDKNKMCPFVEAGSVPSHLDSQGEEETRMNWSKGSLSCLKLCVCVCVMKPWSRTLGSNLNFLSTKIISCHV